MSRNTKLTPNLREQFGRLLFGWRTHFRLTQVMLAERADVGCSYVQRLESGQATPGLVVIERIAASLNMTPREFLEGAPTDAFTSALLNLLWRIPEPRRRLALHHLAILAGCADPLPESFRHKSISPL